MTKETRQARWRRQRLKAADRLDLYLDKDVARRLRELAKARGCQPGVLAVEMLTTALNIENSKP
jgi:uncharacterized Fe-S cluster-containing radical SAM superfamily protein